MTSLSSADIFARFYLTLEQQQPLQDGAVVYRFFSRKSGAYFTVHGSNALAVAARFLHTDDIKDFGTQYPLKAAIVKADQIDAIVRALLSAAAPAAAVVVEFHSKASLDEEWAVSKTGSSSNRNDFEYLFSSSSSNDTEMHNDDAVDSRTVSAQSDAAVPKLNFSSNAAAATAAATAAINPNLVCALHFTTQATQRVVGVAMHIINDSSNNSSVSHWLGYCEFIDGDKYHNLHSLLSQNAHGIPREAYTCIGYSSSNSSGSKKGSNVSHPIRAADQQTITAILQQLNINIRVLEPKHFRTGMIAATTTTEDQLKRLCTNTSIAQHTQSVVTAKQSMTAMSVLIAQLALMSTNVSAHKTYLLESLELRQFMKLDRSAMEALNLFPSSSSAAGSNKSSINVGDKNDSLYGLFNKTRMAAAQRLLRQYISQPLLDVHQIERRHDLVQLFVSDHSLRNRLFEQLKSLQDIEAVVNKLQSERASLKEVVVLYQLIERLPSIVASLASHSSSAAHHELLAADFTGSLQSLQQVFSDFSALVRTTVDLAAVNRHEFIINSNYDPVLTAIHDKKQQAERGMDGCCTAAARLFGVPVKRVLDVMNGWCMRVTRSDEKQCRSHKSHFEVLSTRKDGVRFSNDDHRQHASSYTTYTQQYATAQRRIALDVIAIAVTYTEPFSALNDVLAELAVMLLFAHAAVHNEYVRPVVLPVGGGMMVAYAARHPCLEVVMKSSSSSNNNDDNSSISSGNSSSSNVFPAKDYIANDIVLLKDHSNVQIITGPNMGGKSTYIRTLGVIALMSQIGSWVPCSHSPASAETTTAAAAAAAGEQPQLPAATTLTVVTAILARVGASDHQQQGVSTFMCEMLEAASVLKVADADALVIIDELGRGTSTSDGFGLAWAMCKYLAVEVQCYALFASHFFELTQLEDVCSNVINMHVNVIATGGGQQQQQLTAATTSAADAADADNTEASIVMQYTVSRGAASQSFGVHVARVAGFPLSVVRTAQQKAQELERTHQQQQQQQQSVNGVLAERLQAQPELVTQAAAAAVAAAAEGESSDEAIAAFYYNLYNSKSSSNSSSQLGITA